mmetsp:Transcript_36543/g.107930  ORF Transcript_36543/g.107930 Transcript_36543/m.107930 type:complete len:263 (-) Transcript_36543:185-973(-)
MPSMRCMSSSRHVSATPTAAACARALATMSGDTSVAVTVADGKASAKRMAGWPGPLATSRMAAGQPSRPPLKRRSASTCVSQLGAACRNHVSYSAATSPPKSAGFAAAAAADTPRDQPPEQRRMVALRGHAADCATPPARHGGSAAAALKAPSCAQRCALKSVRTMRMVRSCSAPGTRALRNRSHGQPSRQPSQQRRSGRVALAGGRRTALYSSRACAAAGSARVAGPACLPDQHLQQDVPAIRIGCPLPGVCVASKCKWSA